MLLIYEIIKKFIQRTSAPMCDMLKKFAEKKNVQYIAPHFLIIQTRKHWSVACKFYTWNWSNLLSSLKKKKKKAKQKPTHQNDDTNPQFVSLLYTDLSTEEIEEVHWIYRILCCSGSFRVTALPTRFSALLSLISKVQDPLCDHNWLYNSWSCSCVVLF